MPTARAGPRPGLCVPPPGPDPFPALEEFEPDFEEQDGHWQPEPSGPESSALQPAPPEEVPSPSKRKAAAPAPDPTIVVDRSDEIAQIDVEMRRLGWTKVQGRTHLQDTYGKRSRQQLTDQELLSFLEFLASQPSPDEAPF